MKLLIVAALSLLTIQTAFAADQTTQEKEVQIGISGVYIPAGTKANTDAYVVVNGVFQNGCYKWKRADITVTDDFNREIKSIASVTQGMCIMVLIPFQKEVHLGPLPAGTHTLKFLNGDGTYLEKTLVIE
ncbi:MAG: hypothetical protein ACXWQQ_08925 [Pseudobdellovibrio sp.]